MKQAWVKRDFWFACALLLLSPLARAQDGDVNEPFIHAPVPLGPSITGFSFSVTPLRTNMTITGLNLGGTHTVSIAGVAVQSKFSSTSNQVVFSLPGTAVNGLVKLSATAGSAISSMPALLPPFVSSMSTSSGSPGTSVTLTGRNLRNTFEVRIGPDQQEMSSLSVTSALQVSAVIPPLASSGLVEVKSPGGSAPAADFAVTVPAPTGLALDHPRASPGNVSSPDIRVLGVQSGQTVSLHRDASCSMVSLSGQAVSAGSSVEIESAPLSVDGTYFFHARVTQPGGDQSVCSAVQLSYTLDQTAPVLTGLQNFTQPAQRRTFNWSCSESGCEYQFAFSDNPDSIPVSAFSPQQTAQSNFGPNANGVFFFHIRARDPSGNLSQVQHFSFVLDNTPPPQPALSFTNGTVSPSNNRQPFVLVQGLSPGDTVKLHATQNGAGCTSSNMRGTGAVPLNVPGVNSTVVTTNLSLLNQGAYLLRVSITDAAENVLSCSQAGLEYVVDLVPPVPPVIQALGPNPGPNNPQFSVGSVNAGDQITLHLGGCTGTQMAQVIANATGILVTSASLPGPGTFVFTAKAKDPAGNSSSCSNEVSYTVTSGGTANPTITGFAPQGGLPGASVTLSGSGFTSGMKVRIGVGPITPATLSPAGLIFVVPNEAGAGGKIDVISGTIPVASTANTTLGAYGNGSFEILSPTLQACNPMINEAQSLAITSAAVREDVCRTCWGTACPSSCSAEVKSRWHFYWLMSQMKPEGMSTSSFISLWLRRWAETQVTNNWPHTLNNGAFLIQQMAAAYHDPQNNDAPLLNPSNQDDFRLVSILFRPDLDGTATRSAGEGRFVFSMSNGAQNGDEIILEYKLPVSMGVNPVSAPQWYLRMARLSALDFSLEPNRLRLQRLTDAFAAKNFSGVPGMTNGSGINQVRTNAIAREGGIWTLREFRLFDTDALPQDSSAQQFFGFFSSTPTTAGALGPNTLGELAHFTNHGSPGEPVGAPPNAVNEIGDFVAQNANAFAQGTASLGNEQSHLWGGKDQGHHFNEIQLPSSIPPGAQMGFRMSTCGGCHGGNANRFLMVDGINGANQVFLKPFMTGNPSGLIGSLGLGFHKGHFATMINQPFSSTTGIRNDNYSDLHVRAKVLINQVMQNFCLSSNPAAATVGPTFLNF